MISPKNDVTLHTAQRARLRRGEVLELFTQARVGTARTLNYAKQDKPSLVDIIDKKALAATPWPSSPRSKHASVQQRATHADGKPGYIDSEPLPKDWANRLAAFVKRS